MGCPQRCTSSKRKWECSKTQLVSADTVATPPANITKSVYGSQRYKTGDDSKNNFILSPAITSTEGWHNNHHYYAASTRQGFYWWEIDTTYYMLRGLQAPGLIWDIREVPAHVREGKNKLARLRPGAPFTARPLHSDLHPFRFICRCRLTPVLRRQAISNLQADRVDRQFFFRRNPSILRHQFDTVVILPHVKTTRYTGAGPHAEVDRKEIRLASPICGISTSPSTCPARSSIHEAAVLEPDHLPGDFSDTADQIKSTAPNTANVMRPTTVPGRRCRETPCTHRLLPEF